MVAKIKTTKRLGKVMNYNEHKVQQGQAHIIDSSGFLKEPDRMTFHEKMERFERANSLNPEAKTNTMHLKVSFDPSEKDMSDQKMAEIVQAYMKGIGFKDQPYLAYRHTDTQVPHIHIVTTMITAEGKRIRDFNIGKDKSIPTMERIEKEFGLVRAKDHRQQVEYKVKPVDLQKVVYGEETTRQAMKQTLRTVMEDFNYTSMGEYNAILRNYNIAADTGGKGSRVKAHNGLLYKIVDDQGATVGIPVKASDFYFSPTKKALEQKFKENSVDRKGLVNGLRSKMNAQVSTAGDSLEKLVDKLHKEGIETVIWKAEDGRAYGVTYVDMEKHVAVKGSDLGPEWTLKGLSKKYSSDSVEGLSERLQELKADRSLSESNTPARGKDDEKRNLSGQTTAKEDDSRQGTALQKTNAAIERSAERQTPSHSRVPASQQTTAPTPGPGDSSPSRSDRTPPGRSTGPGKPEDADKGIDLSKLLGSSSIFNSSSSKAPIILGDLLRSQKATQGSDEEFKQKKKKRKKLSQ